MAVFAGVAGSMVGVGGDIVVVPVLTLVFDVPIKVAIATSLIRVIATSSAALGVLVGARFGPRLAVRLRWQTLSVIFQVLRLALAVLMALRVAEV